MRLRAGEGPMIDHKYVGDEIDIIHFINSIDTESKIDERAIQKTLILRDKFCDFG